MNISLQGVAAIIGIVVGAMTLLKHALDIAGSPGHRSRALQWFTIAKDFVPFSLLALGTVVFSTTLVFAALFLGVLNFILTDGPMKRVETAYFVVFSGGCFAMLVLILLFQAAERRIETLEKASPAAGVAAAK